MMRRENLVCATAGRACAEKDLKVISQEAGAVDDGNSDWVERLA